ncbi:Type cbb3 cytochrome oxidase biogenesis protein CcoG, involved in Cu oxidation, partial [hydrothermal vent metagenome]
MSHLYLYDCLLNHKFANYIKLLKTALFIISMKQEGKEKFRDSIGTISESGKRNFIFPKKPKGRFYNYRTYVSWVLLAFLVSAPFIKIKGNQFLLFDVIERK